MYWLLLHHLQQYGQSVQPFDPQAQPQKVVGSQLLLGCQPLMVRSAKSGFEMQSLPKLIASQLPLLILLMPISGVKESFAMTIPEKKGRRVLQTSYICSLPLGYFNSCLQNSVDSLSSTKPTFLLSSSLRRVEYVQTGCSSNMSSTLETGVNFMPTLEGAKQLRVMSISYKQNLSLFQRDPPYWSFLWLEHELRKVCTKQP